MDTRLKSETLAVAQLLYGSAICVLIVLGMSGAIYKVIGPRGFLEQAFGAAMTGEFTLILVAIVIAALACAARVQFSSRMQGRLWGAIIYLFGMLGALFAVRLATLGTL